MEKYDVKFKKKYGQNFLKNISVVKKIVDCAPLDKNSLVIEVGPGGGVMTKELALVAKEVIAYEIDQELTNELNNRLGEFDNIHILFQDFLNADLEKDLQDYKYDKLFFISNVPYYITTPIIIKILESKLAFQQITLMVQKEVGERISSLPGRKEYGSISVFLQTFYDIKKEFIVSRGNFIPEPNVDSVVVSFIPKNDINVLDIDYYQKFIRDAFQFKRKTLRNNLKNYNLTIISNLLEKNGFNLSSRAEMIPYQIFVEIANELYKKENK